MGEQVPIRVSAAEVIAGAEVPIGEPRIRTISRGAVDVLLGESTPLDDRRQRAREAFYDGTEPGDVVTNRALDGAIETATRVRITPEALASARTGLESRIDMYVSRKAVTEVLTAALTELGFEVEQ